MSALIYILIYNYFRLSARRVAAANSNHLLI